MAKKECMAGRNFFNTTWLSNVIAGDTRRVIARPISIAQALMKTKPPPLYLLVAKKP